MRPEQIKQRLEKLDPSILADALIQLSDKDKQAKMLVGRLITTPAESITVFKRKLSGIKRRRSFISRSGSHALSNELEELIKLIDQKETPPEEALQCLVSFFESDHQILGNADDSNGNISWVFKHNATQLLIQKSQQLGDQSTLLSISKLLMKENSYGVRDTLFSSMSDFLNAASLRDLFEHLQQQYQELKLTEPTEEHSYGKVFSAKIGLETTARQLNDPELYEKILLKEGELKLHDYQIVDVAQAYFDAAQPETALEKLNTLETIPFNSIREHKKLLIDIHASMGNNDEIKSIKIEEFLTSPSVITYKDMCEQMNEAEAQQLLDQCLKKQQNENRLQLSHLSFLQDLEMWDLANDYLLMRSDQLDGGQYYTLPDIAQTFEDHDGPLAATHIYRALLISILERARTTSYSHGANYLQTLDRLSNLIDNWQETPPHQEFHQTIQEKHARKSSFWKHVETKNLNS